MRWWTPNEIVKQINLLPAEEHRDGSLSYEAQLNQSCVGHVHVMSRLILERTGAEQRSWERATQQSNADMLRSEAWPWWDSGPDGRQFSNGEVNQQVVGCASKHEALRRLAIGMRRGFRPTPKWMMTEESLVALIESERSRLLRDAGAIGSAQLTRRNTTGELIGYFDEYLEGGNEGFASSLKMFRRTNGARSERALLVLMAALSARVR